MNNQETTSTNNPTPMNQEALAAIDILEMILNAQWRVDSYELMHPGMKIGVISAESYIKAMELHYEIHKTRVLDIHQSQLVSQLNREWSTGLINGHHPALKSATFVGASVYFAKQVAELNKRIKTMPSDESVVKEIKKFISLIANYDTESFRNVLSLSTLNIIAHDLTVELNLYEIHIRQEQLKNRPKDPIPGIIERLNQELKEAATYLDSIRLEGNQYDLQSRELLHNLHQAALRLREYRSFSAQHNEIVVSQQEPMNHGFVPEGFYATSRVDTEDLLSKLGLGFFQRG